MILFIFGFFVSAFPQSNNQLVIGASQLNEYLPILNNKRVAVVANQTSLVDNTHLIDTLLSSGVSIIKVYAPEHGFRGKADAGASITDERDPKTNLPVLSLYGKNKKPKSADLDSIDLMIFDIQDVGARFYTYISTLHYVMEACAENNIPLLVLDRPNPNGHYVDGPLLDTAYASFVGMHPIPIVHGLTIGEYAQMINGEYWLNDSIQCDLQVQQMQNYTHKYVYDLPAKPSPNLPNAKSISLYPSLCLFEGTAISVGRGTNKQFQIIGSPELDSCSFTFSPISGVGATYPKHENVLCCGWDFSDTDFKNEINLSYLIETFEQYNAKGLTFFNSFFDKLAGSNKLRVMIEAGWSSAEIKETWQLDLEAFKQKRKNYLIYSE
ncbi:MAG: Uncharacterised protein [Cryomorphaceae bacterium]|nr:MAG: Uncharacterised protein [Cryomorphaceae bacterium]